MFKGTRGVEKNFKLKDLDKMLNKTQIICIPKANSMKLQQNLTGKTSIKNIFFFFKGTYWKYCLFLELSRQSKLSVNNINTF